MSGFAPKGRLDAKVERLMQKLNHLLNEQCMNVLSPNTLYISDRRSKCVYFYLVADRFNRVHPQ